ncbi:N-acetyltransferase GCN5 [Natrialba chahannaoensis JCM 10990]|uniref:N-acetyltransferase GCN5 n=1 Tax=Natrialba chahannaoensis JCM 10990 TaxID=1227492 RepID=M0AWX7_9EURY|nr:GNAT family N-acetyltransferase [Natrialba chahannaoensis]ELZ03196.1 N-acetyltransferase GCN5 [Natrialba chahannaoensis JCM 10990]
MPASEHDYMAGDIHVRTATAADELEIRRILDAAMLTFEDLEARLAAGDVLVAGDRQGGSTDSNHTPESEDSSARANERILGTLVLAPVPPETDGCSTGTKGADGTSESTEPARESAHIAAIAVRRRHRGQGIGRALVTGVLESESESERRVTAHFDADVRPFYESLGFSIEPLEVVEEAGSANSHENDNATRTDRFRGIAVATDDESDTDSDSETDPTTDR